MPSKVHANITKVKINAATYKDVSFEPTLINFFYGKNGTGKSTLARAFNNGSANLTWNDEIPKEQIHIYNDKYIEANIRSYGNIPGVFTISEVNAEKKKQIDEATDNRDEILLKAKAAKETAERIAEAHSKAETDLHNLLWKKTETLRKKYPETQKGFKTDSAKFANELIKATPSDDTDEDCQTLYQTAFGKENPSYSEYRDVRTIPVNQIMETSIVSRSNTDFALFIRTLGSMDWVTHGYNTFHEKTDGRCPYCQQALPSDFEEKFNACCDAQYNRDKAELARFIDSYRQMMTSVQTTIESNLQNQFPSKLKEDYKSQAKLIYAAIRRNEDLLSRKENNPSESVILEDLSPLAEELNRTASAINEEIRAYMAVLADIPGQRQKCIEMVWGMLARECKDEIETWNKKIADDRVAWSTAHENEKQLREEAKHLDEEITRLNSQTVNTTQAMEDINRLITTAGFTGFQLQEKPGATYVYELVRDINGIKTVVNQDLSEGERHFIAFLYFYHTVMGSQSDDGKQQTKIVIVDDPVSSMDSSALFVVASLTRKMIDVCYNNYDLNSAGRDKHISQFFCLTHNPYFFREISFNRIRDYECVTFYEIKKNEQNETSIAVCEDERPYHGGMINTSPVKNTYDALWDEYLHTQKPETLMIVIRKILEYYFVQIVGYHVEDLRSELQNSSDFSDADLTVARAMVAMIDVGSEGFNDGLYYDASAVSLEVLRNIFKKIFIALKHEQHFNAMTGK